jgi:hypothetical protein
MPPVLKPETPIPAASSLRPETPLLPGAIAKPCTPLFVVLSPRTPQPLALVPNTPGPVPLLTEATMGFADVPLSWRGTAMLGAATAFEARAWLL